MKDLVQALTEAIDTLAGLSEELACEADTLRTHLEAPPRVVVVGRLKAGKSTLVNALIGAPVSETAALEATIVVTIFHYGAPDRGEAVLKNNQRIPITTMRGHTTTLPVPASDIAYVNRWMTSSSIADYTLIDTPGLATLTQENEDTTRTALLRTQTTDAAVDADAAIYLFDTTPRHDEVEFLKQLGFTPLNTLGILSRADSFGQGALGKNNPLEQAKEFATILHDQLGDYLTDVIPVAGLLAESACTGRINNQLAKTLSEWAGKDTSRIMENLTSQNPNPELVDLIDQVGEYGFFRGRQHASIGAAELEQWLETTSNIDQVKKFLATQLTPLAQLHKAGRIIHTFEKLSYRYPHHRETIRSLSTKLEEDPRLTSAVLLHDLKALLDAQGDAELVDEVTRIIKGTTHGAKLGLTRFATGYDILTAVDERTTWLNGFNTSFLSAAEEATIYNLRKIYAGLREIGEALI